MEFEKMPKVWKKRIRHYAEIVASGAFTAEDVAALLLLARPTQPYNALHDFADGLAHPVRNKGHAQYLATKFDAFNSSSLVKAGRQPLGDTTRTNPKSRSAVARIDNTEISKELHALFIACGVHEISCDVMNDFIVCLCVLAHGEELVVEGGNRLRLEMTVFRRAVSLDLVNPRLAQIILLQVTLTGDVWWDGAPISHDMFIDFSEDPVLTSRDAEGRLNITATAEPLIAPTSAPSSLCTALPQHR